MTTPHELVVTRDDEPVRPLALAGASPVEHLIELAIAHGNIESIKELVALKNQQDDRAAKREYLSARTAFKAACPPILKVTELNYLSSVSKAGVAKRVAYAPWEEIDRIVTPVLTLYGLSYEGKEVDAADSTTATVILSHVAGHSESSTVTVPFNLRLGDKLPPASLLRAARTTAMRTALENVLGIVARDMPDGEQQLAPPVVTIDERQAAGLEELLEQWGGDRTAYLRWAGLQRLADMPRADYAGRVAGLHKAIHDKGKAPCPVPRATTA